MSQKFKYDDISLQSKVVIPLSTCVAMKNVLDICAQRGVFVSDEFEILGEIVKNLRGALNEVAQKQIQRQRGANSNDDNSTTNDYNHSDDKRIVLNTDDLDNI